MNKKLDEIKTLKYEDKQISVSSLPEKIRNDVEILQNILQKRMDTTFELEMLDLASKMKMAQINDALVEYFKPINSIDSGQSNG